MLIGSHNYPSEIRTSIFARSMRTDNQSVYQIAAVSSQQKLQSVYTVGTSIGLFIAEKSCQKLNVNAMDKKLLNSALIQIKRADAKIHTASSRPKHTLISNLALCPKNPQMSHKT